MHSATRTSDYQSTDLAVATVFTAADGPNGTWQMANLNHDGYVDLVFIKTHATGSGMIEYFRATIGSDYQTLVEATPTLFSSAEADLGSFSTLCVKIK